MLRRRRGHCDFTIPHAMRLPPVELDDALRLHAPGFEVRADAERRDERHIGLREHADRGIVEMIVVVVRHDDDIDRRHRAKRDGYWLEALGTDEARGRGTG